MFLMGRGIILRSYSEFNVELKNIPSRIFRYMALKKKKMRVKKSVKNTIIFNQDDYVE